MDSLCPLPGAHRGRRPGGGFVASNGDRLGANRPSPRLLPEGHLAAWSGVAALQRRRTGVPQPIRFDEDDRAMRLPTDASWRLGNVPLDVRTVPADVEQVDTQGMGNASDVGVKRL